VDEAKAACCKNQKCAGFSFRGGSGYFKADQDCGKVNNTAYVGYSKISSTDAPVDRINITLDLTEVGFSSDDEVLVYDIWSKENVGTFKGTYTAADVPVHGSAFIRLSKHILV